MLLYYKIMLGKGDYDNVIQFLHLNEASFGIILDKRKLVFKALLRKGDKLGAINELLAIIKTNYESVEGEFQSIYDHHEIMISLLIDLCKERGVTINEEFILSELDLKEEPI